MENKNEGLRTEANAIFAKVAGVMAFLLLFIFPLYVEKRYANILRAKYHFYYIVVLAALAIILIMALVFMFIDIMENRGAETKEFFAKFKPGNWKKTFTFHEAALIIFMIAVVISTLQSDYLYESVWGNEGRFSGAFLLLVYAASVFIIGRLFRFKQWYLEAFLVSSMLVCLFGITDYFRLDVMGFKADIIGVGDIFTSTFGNINTYTAFVALVMGVAAVLYVTADTRKKVIWYYICVSVSITAAITGQSDNVYLAFAVLFGFLPFYAFGSRKGVKRYVIMLATIFTVMKVLAILDLTLKGDEWGNVIGLDGLAKVIGHFSGTTVIVLILWAVTAILYYIDFNKKKSDDAGKWPKRVWGGIVIAAVFVVVAIVIDANFAGHGERYGALSNYVIFSDEWGTDRGFAWRFAMELYNDFPLHHKIFGYGADTFGILTTSYTGSTATKMYESLGVIYDSVHNAYLQYFVTIGPAGLIPYIAFLVSSIMWMIKKAGKSPAVMACVFAAACYSGQAVVNIDLPAVTPVFWTILAVGIAAARMKIKEEKEKN